MASSEELFEAVKDELEKNGLLNKVHAEVRSALVDLLNLKKRQAEVNVPRDTAIICELIREFLEFHHYNYSTSIFTAESGLPETPMNRSLLCEEINVQDSANSRRLPLLYGLLSTYQKENEPSESSQ